MAISAKDLTAKDAVAFIKKRPIPIVCGLASLLLLVGAYYRSSTLAEMETQQKQKEDEGKQILENVSNGTNLPEQLDTLVAATKEMESRLVLSSERARNQQYFYRIESETGVKEVSLQPGSSSESTGRGPRHLYTGVGYTVSVQGDYHQILGFLGHLEAGQQFYRLLSASVSRQGQRGGPDATGAIALTLNLELLGLP
jgi:Tfp pilus assembly protein PilO